MAGKPRSPELPRCGAKLKNQDGVFCQNLPVKGGRRCRYHGGAGTFGPANPAYRHGKHSKYLPESLLERYNEALADPDLLSLKEEIAIVDARYSELLQSLHQDGNTGGKTWFAVKDLWSKFYNAVVSSDKEEQMKLFPQLDEAIKRGNRQAAIWYDIEKLIDQKRKLSDTETRKLETRGQFITVEQAMMLVSATILSLKEAAFAHADPTTARKIVAEASVKYKQIVGPVADD